MNNCTIHKLEPMIRKIENRGYRIMFLLPYSPDLKPIKHFWSIVKGRIKCHRLLTKENLSNRIRDTYNNIPIENLASFAGHSKRLIVNRYTMTPL